MFHVKHNVFFTFLYVLHFRTRILTKHATLFYIFVFFGTGGDRSKQVISKVPELYRKLREDQSTRLRVPGSVFECLRAELGCIWKVCWRGVVWVVRPFNIILDSDKRVLCYRHLTTTSCASICMYELISIT